MTKIKTILSQRSLLSFLAGIFYAAGFPMPGNFSFVFGTLIGFFLFFRCLKGQLNSSTKASYFKSLSIVLTFSLGYYSLGYYWIPETLREFGSIPRPLNYFLGLFFSIFIIPQYIFFAIIYTFKEKNNHNFLFIKNKTMRNIILASILTLLEYWTPQQFPAHLGHPLLSLKPFLGLASIFGAPIYSFMGYWTVFTCYNLKEKKIIDYYFLCCLGLFLFFNIAFPLVAEKEKKHTTQHHIRLVQANIGNPLKLSSELGKFNAIKKVYETYKELSLLPSQAPLDLIIWPETAYPSLLSSTALKQTKNFIPGLFQKILNAKNAELFVGGYDRPRLSNDGYFETEYNTAFLFSPADIDHEQQYLKDWYYKMKMIPFGETLPFGPFNKFLSEYITNVSYFAKGNKYTLFKTKNGTPFIAAICYEILYSHFIRKYLNNNPENPHFLINLTNDSWYGDTSEPYQHLMLSKWRALEFNLPIIRSTNTGITSIIYPDGSESERIGVFKKAKLDIILKTNKRNPTLFQIWGIYGNIALYLLLLLILFCGLKLFKRKAFSD